MNKKITIRKDIEGIDRYGWNEQFRRDLINHAGKTAVLRDYRETAEGYGKAYRFNLHSSDGLNWHNRGEWYVNEMNEEQFNRIFTVITVELPEDLFTL